jgi:hypothetical protein
MSKRFRIASPSPAMIVAIIALCFAVTGTGIAAIGTFGKKEKQQIRKIARKIADKRITLRAPNLSVKSAGTAGSAVTADSAKLAGRANSAGSADTADTAAIAGNVSNQMWAIVNANGTLFRASPGIVEAKPEGPGPAEGKTFVIVDRDVTNCFFQATLGGNPPNEGLAGDISVAPVTGSPNEVYVRTGDNAGSNAALPFTLLIRC